MLADIAPLTQIFAALLLGLSAFNLNEYIKRDFQKIFLLASALIIVTPFYLYNLSYRFDSFGMILSIFLTVQAFCLSIKNRLGSKASIGLLIAALSLYQSGINMFIALAAIETLLLSQKNDIKNIFQRLFLRASQYCIAFIIYYLTIGQVFTFASGSARSGLVSISLEGLERVISNLEIFIHIGSQFFSATNAFYIITFALFCLIGYVRFLYRSPHKTVQSLGLLLAFMLYFLSLFGPMILLQTSNAGFRTMPTFFMFAPLLVIFSALARQRFSYVWLIPLLLTIAVSYQYGVVAKHQRDYEKANFNLIHYDLLQHQLDQKPTYIIGRFKRAPHAELITKTQPFIASSLGPLGRWAAESFFQGQGLKQVQFHWDSQYNKIKPMIEEDICHKKNTVITENSLYSIYNIEDKNYVILSSNKAHYCDQ